MVYYIILQGRSDRCCTMTIPDGMLQTTHAMHRHKNSMKGPTRLYESRRQRGVTLAARWKRISPDCRVPFVVPSDYNHRLPWRPIQAHFSLFSHRLFGISPWPVEYIPGETQYSIIIADKLPPKSPIKHKMSARNPVQMAIISLFGTKGGTMWTRLR